MEYRHELIIKALFVAFLFATLVTADDFRNEFGENLNTVLRELHSRMIRANLDSYEQYFNTLLSDLGPTDEQRQKFETRLANISALKADINEGQVAEVARRANKLSRNVVAENLILMLTPEISGNSVSYQALVTAFDKVVKTANEELKHFALALYDKWTELYASIPAEELSQNAEYEQLNEKIEKFKASGENSGQTAVRDELLRDLMENFADFFGYEDWKNEIEE